MNQNSDFYLYDSFIESPIYDNWFKKHYPQTSFLICSPYIKKDAIDKIIALYNLDNRTSDFQLKVLIRGNTEEFTYQKSSDVAAFDSLITLKGFDIANVRRIGNLHMKAYLIDGKHLLITSGNMTNSGLFVISGKENFEGGISCNDPSIILKFMRYFSDIWKQSQELEHFYDDLIESYTKYIETEYSDKKTFQRLNKKSYIFNSYTSLDESSGTKSTGKKGTSGKRNSKKSETPQEPTLDELLVSLSTNDAIENENQVFSLSDIPPVGRPEHLYSTLQIINSYPDGITYLDLGKKLRHIFSDSESETDGANRKFGEEKGKFAAFLGFASIDTTGRSMSIKINNLGKAYLNMTDDNRNKLIKDIFFDKPIIVSILRHSLEDSDFDLLEFLVKNCEGATRSTLSRKVGPLKELFSLIKNICTEDELKQALEKV